ncbi:MAG: hypothetical protein KJO44_04185 [Gemmatimonadetes bacterium]|nr:hypothetical protein [Gemmatimonadota bacterium]
MPDRFELAHFAVGETRIPFAQILDGIRHPFLTLRVLGIENTTSLNMTEQLIASQIQRRLLLSSA